MEGPLGFGIFKPGERLLTQNNQSIERTTSIPAKLGHGLAFAMN